MFGDMHVMQIRKLQVIIHGAGCSCTGIQLLGASRDVLTFMSIGDVSVCAHKFSSDPTLFNSASQKSASCVVKCTLKYAVDFLYHLLNSYIYSEMRSCEFNTQLTTL